MPPRNDNPLPPLEADEDSQPIGKVVRSEAQLDAAASKAQKNRTERQMAAFAKQPRVEIRLAEDTTVLINGCGFYIKGKETVKVPEQVRDYLISIGRY